MMHRFRRVCLIASCSLSLTAAEAQQESFEEFWKRGSALSQKGDYASAIPELRQAKVLAPQNYSVNLLLGLDLLRSGRPEEALEPLQVAAEANLYDGTANAYLGKALAIMNQFSRAAESFQSAVSRSPSSQELWADLADFYLERFRQLAMRLRSTQTGMAAMLRVSARTSTNGADSREALLRQSALANPNQAGIWGELGAEQLRNGAKEAAASTLETAEQQQGNDTQTLELQAMAAAAHGDWRNAEVTLLQLGDRSPAVLRRMMQTWPPNLSPPAEIPGAIWQCARDHAKDCLAEIALPQREISTQEDVLFSEERWERLAALPTYAHGAISSFRHGVALAEMDDCIHAIPALERGLEADTETSAFWLELCYASDARRAIARLGALGNPALVHRLRGDLLVRVNGDAQSATQEYRQALLLRPQDSGLLERLAQAYLSFGDWEHAEKAAQTALSIDPQRPLTLHVLASVFLNEKNYSEALVYLKKNLAMQPTDPWTRVQMGIAYAQTGQLQKALDSLQPMLEAGYPDERGALHAALAGILHKLGREREAVTATEEASRLSDLFQRHQLQGANDHH
jgi:tetratricopeptide (TPR) repeat protein